MRQDIFFCTARLLYGLREYFACKFYVVCGVGSYIHSCCCSNILVQHPFSFKTIRRISLSDVKMPYCRFDQLFT